MFCDISATAPRLLHPAMEAQIFFSWYLRSRLPMIGRGSDVANPFLSEHFRKTSSVQLYWKIGMHDALDHEQDN